MYMSPEQLQGGEVDVRSDLYSLGVTLFHVLAGKPPFSGETPLALAMQHVQAQAPKLQEMRADVPKVLSRLVERLLAKLPQNRFGNPDEVVAFLRAERKRELAEFWPEQTIPLPGAARPLTSAAPSPATLKLQAQLNRQRRDGRRRWLGLLTLVMVAAATGVIGALYAQSRPRPSLFGNSANMHFGVAKQTSVEQQYQFALFNQMPRNRYLWDAVPYFFPPGNSNKNRLYAGKAWLQAARQMMRQDDEKEKLDADRLLRQVIDFPEMDDLVKSLAWLELAVMARGRGDEDMVSFNINQAATLRDSRLSGADDAIFLQNVPEPFRGLFSSERTSIPGS